VIDRKISQETNLPGLPMAARTELLSQLSKEELDLVQSYLQVERYTLHPMAHLKEALTILKGLDISDIPKCLVKTDEGDALSAKLMIVMSLVDETVDRALLDEKTRQTESVSTLLKAYDATKEEAEKSSLKEKIRAREDDISRVNQAMQLLSCLQARGVFKAIGAGIGANPEPARTYANAVSQPVEKHFLNWADDEDGVLLYSQMISSLQQNVTKAWNKDVWPLNLNGLQSRLEQIAKSNKIEIKDSLDETYKGVTVSSDVLKSPDSIRKILESTEGSVLQKHVMFLCGYLDSLASSNLEDVPEGPFKKGFSVCRKQIICELLRLQRIETKVIRRNLDCPEFGNKSELQQALTELIGVSSAKFVCSAIEALLRMIAVKATVKYDTSDKIRVLSKGLCFGTIRVLQEHCPTQQTDVEEKKEVMRGKTKVFESVIRRVIKPVSLTVSTFQFGDFMTVEEKPLMTKFNKVQQLPFWSKYDLGESFEDRCKIAQSVVDALLARKSMITLRLKERKKFVINSVRDEKGVPIKSGDPKFKAMFQEKLSWCLAAFAYDKSILSLLNSFEEITKTFDSDRPETLSVSALSQDVQCPEQNLAACWAKMVSHQGVEDPPDDDVESDQQSWMDEQIREAEALRKALTRDQPGAGRGRGGKSN